MWVTLDTPLTGACVPCFRTTSQGSAHGTGALAPCQLCLQGWSLWLGLLQVAARTVDPVRKEKGVWSGSSLLPGKVCCTFRPAGTSLTCMHQTCVQPSSLPSHAPGRHVPLMRDAGLCALHRPVPAESSPARLSHAPNPTQGQVPHNAFCCAGYTPEVLAMLRRLREQSVLCASEPYARAGLRERSVSLDGVTTAYRYVRKDEGIPARFWDEAPGGVPPSYEYTFR